MVLLQLRSKVFQVDPWTFRDDQNSISVSKVQDLLSIRVVGCPKHVSTQPFHEVEVFGDEWQVQTTPPDVGVLMLGHASQVHRGVVDVELVRVPRNLKKLMYSMKRFGL